MVFMKGSGAEANVPDASLSIASSAALALHCNVCSLTTGLLMQGRQKRLQPVSKEETPRKRKKIVPTTTGAEADVPGAEADVLDASLPIT